MIIVNGEAVGSGVPKGAPAPAEPVKRGPGRPRKTESPKAAKPKPEPAQPEPEPEPVAEPTKAVTESKEVKP